MGGFGGCFGTVITLTLYTMHLDCLCCPGASLFVAVVVAQSRSMNRHLGWELKFGMLGWLWMLDYLLFQGRFRCLFPTADRIAVWLVWWLIRYHVHLLRRPPLSPLLLSIVNRSGVLFQTEPGWCRWFVANLLPLFGQGNILFGLLPGKIPRLYHNPTLHVASNVWGQFHCRAFTTFCHAMPCQSVSMFSTLEISCDFEPYTCFKSGS